jgi:hypothetical protein
MHLKKSGSSVIAFWGAQGFFDLFSFKNKFELSQRTVP